MSSNAGMMPRPNVAIINAPPTQNWTTVVMAATSHSRPGKSRGMPTISAMLNTMMAALSEPPTMSLRRLSAISALRAACSASTWASSSPSTSMT